MTLIFLPTPDLKSIEGRGHRTPIQKIFKEKPFLQSKFTLLQSKFFPAKMPFSKIQKKNLAGKNTLQKSEFYFAKERGSFFNLGVAAISQNFRND
jgi:hypothetical protein